MFLRRIYNGNPTFPLEDPKRFTVDLLDFIQANLEHLQVIPKKQSTYKLCTLQGQNLFPTEETKNGDLALQSLAHVIKYARSIIIIMAPFTKYYFCIFCAIKRHI